MHWNIQNKSWRKGTHEIRRKKCLAIQASHCYGVPSRTIYDRVAKARNEAKHKKDKDHPLQTLDNFKSELTSEMVNEKIEYILVNKLEQDQE
jgi:hypothetical protein